MSATATPTKLTKKDFLSNVSPRWCPGCGSYAVLSALTKVFAALEIPKENYAIISGIGCSSRLPYYADTFGFHTIHGRAPTVATGLKISRPDLSVWIVTGDGDALSIGGNHFVHLMRRNVDVKIILFNNQIYGLTKGQASPTSQVGQKTKSTPFGSIDTPLQPVSVALAAGAGFAARVPDTDLPLMDEVLTAAAKHKGTAFIEVLQNCVIFNDGAFDEVTDKAKRAETTVRLKAGEPLVYGVGQDKVLVNEGFKFRPAPRAEADPASLYVHRPDDDDPAAAFALSRLTSPAFPLPVGIFRRVERPSYEEMVGKIVNAEEFDTILRGSNSWAVDKNYDAGAFEG